MKFHPFFGLVVVLSVFASLLPSSTSAHSSPLTERSLSGNEPVVVVVEDKSKENGCRVLYRTESTLESVTPLAQLPDNSADVQLHGQPCPDGSLLLSRKLPLSEAKQRGLTDVVILTGNKEQDAKAINQLFERKQDYYHSISSTRTTISPLSTCGAQTRQSQFYYYYNNVAGRQDIYVTVRYRIFSDCRILGIEDSTKAGSGATCWQSSTATNRSGQVEATNRNLDIGNNLITVGTPAIPTISQVGGTYRHIVGSGMCNNQATVASQGITFIQ